MAISARLTALPAYWRNSGVAGKLLLSLLGICVTVSVFFAVLVTILPEQVTPVSVAPRFAGVQTGAIKRPLNLPEPAAGGATVKIPLTLPTRTPDKKLQNQPAEQAQETPAIAKEAPSDKMMPEATDLMALPRTRTPRRPLAKYAALSGDLILPQVATDGSTPLDYYASPAPPETDKDKARIALIVTGVGLNTARSEAALEGLPKAVTIAVSPYGQDPQRWINQALDQRREALMMVPMEPNSFPSVDPGPDTLMRDAPEIQTIERLHTVLSKAQGYVGIINDTGSRFTANAIALAPVLDDVSKRGIMVVDARASAYSVLAAEAAKRQIPIAINTRFVDSSLTTEDIRRQLRDLERTAQTLGVAVGVLRDFPVSIEQVLAWEKTLDRDAFILASISAVANQQPVR